MSALIKRIILTSCVFIMMIASCFMFGSAAWYFFDDISTSTSATDIADNLRPNQIFGDGQDTVILDTKFYDVYFLAQNVQDIPDPTNAETYLDDTTFFKKIGEIADSDGNIVNNYTFKDQDNKQLYYDDSKTSYTYKYGNDLRHGSWENRASVSPYYWKWTNVNTISASMLSTMGNPHCEMVDKNNWPLTFNSWIINPYDIYVKDNYSHSVYSKDGINYIQVYGSYPFENFETAYFNSLLQIYDSHAIYIDGHRSLFFYPIYSSGKGYYAYTTGGAGSENLRDSIAIINKDTKSQADSSMQEEEFFVYEPTYTDLMLNYGNGLFIEKGSQTSTDKTRFRAYRFTEYIVNSVDVSETKGYIQNDIDLNNSSWPGTKDILTSTINNNTSTIYLNSEPGRYNFYLFVKERYVEGRNLNDKKKDAKFSEAEKTVIRNFFYQDSLHIYKILDCDVHEHINNSYYYDSRDYILIIEKMFEPCIIGHKTGALEWTNANSRNLFFVRNGTTKETMDSYTIRDIDFNCDDGMFGYIDYTVPNTQRKIKIPDYYFGVQISQDTNLVYNESIGYENEYNYDSSKPNETPPYEVPKYKYIDVDGSTREEPYMSHELLISLKNAVADDLSKYQEHMIYHDIDRIRVTKANPGSDDKYYTLREYKEAGFSDYDDLVASLVLVRPIETGTYNFFVHIKYGTNADITVYDVPEALGLWAYRKHNIFVNIYDPSDFDGKTISFDGTYINEGMLNKYSFRCDSYYYLDTDFMYEENGNYKRFSRMSGLPDKEGLDKDSITDLYDIHSILTYYDKDNKCLQDIVSGRYITLENCSTNPFMVSKNYVFQVVDNPFKR